MNDYKGGAAAIIVAAGAGTRMQGIDKVFSPLAGTPILLRSTQPFQDCLSVSRIIIVVGGEKEKTCRSLVSSGEWSKVTDICAGGARRQDSVSEGLKRIGDAEWVIIHDGARPLVTVEIIERGLKAARETGAAVAAVQVKDTIKTSGENLFITSTPPRKNLWAIQTPQVFRADIISEAYRHNGDDVTDDAALVENTGRKVKIFAGSYNNIKITTPEDLVLAEMLLKQRETSV